MLASKQRKILFLLVNSLILFGCNKPLDDKPSDSEEKIYEKDDEGFYILEEDYFEENNEDIILEYPDFIDNYDNYSPNYRLYHGDKLIPVYSCNVNPMHIWTPNPTTFVKAGVSTISLDGEATFKLQTNFHFLESLKISPLDANVDFEIDIPRRVVTFKIAQPGQYTITLINSMVFHLFVNPPHMYNEQVPTTNNTIVFEKGIYNRNNSPLIDNNNFIHLESNTTVIIKKDAIVEAGFIAVNKTNIHVIGDGIVSGAPFARNATTNEKLIPYEFNFCTNISFKGITTLDPAGWCYNIYFCKNVLLDNIKIISSRSNGDGVSLQSSQDVICKNSFVRTWDDSLVVKNYPNWQNKAEQGITKNITFTKCQVWTDLAQSMELGYETVGEVFEDILFEDITILANFHKAAISIHNGNNAYIKRVKFSNITIENPKMGLGDGNDYLIDFQNLYSQTWSSQHAVTPLGFIEGIEVNNVLLLSKNKKFKIFMQGCKDKRSGYDNEVEHFLKDITLNNIMMGEEVLTTDYEGLIIGDYVYDLSIIHDNSETTGANSLITF
ncbi:MAG: glycosyl hydrolase family 28 protein [Bacilli bacterium]|jgi:hypothetical protein